MSSGSAESALGQSGRGDRAPAGASPWRLVVDPIVINGRRLPSIGLLVLAAVGAVLLIVVATTSWRVGSDELAYWHAAQHLVAGQPLYDPNATPITPYAYWNPPPLAQVLAPFTGLISPDAFTAIWTLLLLGCLWWLGGRSVIVGLALIAFLPVAVELRTRNLHLVLAVLTVLALRRSWVFWIAGTALKISPVLGGVYLLAAGRVREALLTAIVGAAVLVVSVVLAPTAWVDFVTTVGGRAGSDGGALIAVPFLARFAIGAVLAGVGGWLVRPRAGGVGLGRTRLAESLLVVGLTVANPTLWATALSLLIAIVPLWRTARGSGAADVVPVASAPAKTAALDAPTPGNAVASAEGVTASPSGASAGS